MIVNGASGRMYALRPVDGDVSSFERDKSMIPTTSDMIAFIDFALTHKRDPEYAEVLARLSERYIGTSTKSLSHSEGVIVYEDSLGTMPSNREGLLKCMVAGNKGVRVVEPGFKTGFMPIKDWLENPYTLAQIGGDMLPAAERVAKAFHRREAYIYGGDRSESEEVSQTVLHAITPSWLGGAFMIEAVRGFRKGIKLSYYRGRCLLNDINA